MGTEIGKRIARLRKREGVSQQELGDLLGVARQSVSKWESGRSVPDLTYLIRMGEIFHVTMDELILGKEGSDQSGEGQGADGGGQRTPPFFLLTAIGIVLLFLLPLFARLYRNYIFMSEGVAHTSAAAYLSEWPLCGVVWIAGLCLFGGLGGIWWRFKGKPGPKKP